MAGTVILSCSFIWDILLYLCFVTVSIYYVGQLHLLVLKVVALCRRGLACSAAQRPSQVTRTRGVLYVGYMWPTIVGELRLSSAERTACCRCTAQSFVPMPLRCLSEATLDSLWGETHIQSSCLQWASLPQLRGGHRRQILLYAFLRGLKGDHQVVPNWFMHKIMQFSPFPVRPCDKPKHNRRYERLTGQFITKPYTLNLVFQTLNLKMVAPAASKSQLVFSHLSLLLPRLRSPQVLLPSDHEAASLSPLRQKLCPQAASRTF